MYDPGHLVLQGRRTEIRPMLAEDAEMLQIAAAEDRSTYSYNWVPNHDDATAYVETALSMKKQGHRYPFVVVHKGRVVGSTSYADYQPWKWPASHQQKQRSVPDVAEIGYTWLAASVQRTGCNTEAKYLLLRHAFETWKVHRIALRADERNQKSRIAIERLGAKLNGIWKADAPGWDGTIRNSAYYSIPNSDWAVIRAALEEKMTKYD